MANLGKILKDWKAKMETKNDIKRSHLKVMKKLLLSSIKKQKIKLYRIVSLNLVLSDKILVFLFMRITCLNNKENMLALHLDFSKTFGHAVHVFK